MSYRSDEDARQLRLDYLEVENKQMMAELEEQRAENKKLRADNHRLRIIGEGLMADSKPRPLKVSDVVDLEELRHRMKDIADEVLTTKRAARFGMIMVAFVFGVPLLIRALVGML